MKTHALFPGVAALLIILTLPGCPPPSPPIHVVITSPANGAQGVDLSVTIAITFDLPANKDTLDVTITPAIGFIIGWSTDGCIACLYPATNLAPDVEYTVTVQDVASTDDGWIEDEYNFTFTTQSLEEGELEGAEEGSEEGIIEGEGAAEGELEGESEGETPGSYRQAMREFVQAISAYAKTRHPGFIIVPQNGEALLTSDGTPEGAPSQAYLNAIDGQGREDVFFGYDGDDIATPAAVREQFTGMLDFAEARGVQALVADYCSKHSHMDDSYANNAARGYVSFAADSRELDRIPDYPATPYQGNALNITTLTEAKNMLYLLNAESFGGREVYLQAIDATNYDLFIIDLFYDEAALTAPEIAQLKTKANGGRRLLLAYMSIGEAEDYRYYWQAGWHPGTPAWLGAENPDWEGNYKVRYWDPGWRAIIFGSANAYLDRILASGFDGVYLDIIDAYEYFEEQSEEGEEEGLVEGEGSGEGEVAGSFYVSLTGDDTWNGSRDYPWRTIQYAVDHVAEGGTIYVMEGTYNERVDITCSGVPGAYITLAAYPGNAVTVDGTGIDVPQYSGLVNAINVDWIKIRGLRVVNAGPNVKSAGIQVEDADNMIVEGNYTHNTRSSGILVWNSTNVIVKDNEIVLACNGGQNECMTVGGTTSFEVRNNHIHDAGVTESGGEGICIKDGCANGVIHDNHIHTTFKVGLYVDAWDKHTHDLAVFNNLVHDIGLSHGIGVASEGGGLLENIRIYNNVVFNSHLNGMNFGGYGLPEVTIHPIRNVQVINNTFYANGSAEWGGNFSIENIWVENIVIRNNILSQGMNWQIFVDSGVSPEQLVMDHNLIDGFRDMYVEETRGTEYQEGSAGFVNAAACNFHLTAPSPAIDHGSSVDAASFDFDGNARPQGAGYDIGAFEY